MNTEQKGKNLDIELIVETIQAVLPTRSKIALHEPCFLGNEWKYVKECLDTGWVSSVGKYVDLFEEKLAEFVGVKKAIAVVNGTAALHICLKIVGVKQNDEVLVPALTFVATANAVTYCGAVPHFVESEETSLGLDVRKLRDYLLDIAEVRDDGCYNKLSGRRIKAAVPMHTFGHPVDLDKLAAICEEFSIILVEDAAESLGSYYKGKHTGNWGKVSALSFNGNKIITTGGGGAILTNDEELGILAKHITTTAKLPHRWDFNHDQIGYNYRLPNINAALGCAQLEQLPSYISRKRELADRYSQAFKHLEGITFFTEPEYAQSNYWLNTLIVDSCDIELRDILIEKTNASGIMTRPVWKLMHKLPMFYNCPRMELAVAEKLAAGVINIPSSVFL